MAILFEGNRVEAEALAFAIGGDVAVVDSAPALSRTLSERSQAGVVVFGPDADLRLALDFASSHRVLRPDLGVILVRRRVDATVLADALRAGVREVVRNDELSTLTESARRLRDLSERLRSQSHGAGGSTTYEVGQVVTVFSAKGGAGKTTVATNVAAALAEGDGRRVCLLDLDLAFGDVAISLQLLPGKTVADAVAMSANIDIAGVRALVTPHSPGLDTVLAPLEPSQAQGIPPAVAKSLIEVLRTMYDVVVVDTPPDLNDHVLTAFDHSDTIVLLATLDIPSVKNLKLALEMLDAIGYPRTMMRVVVNRADSQVGLSVSDIEQAVKMPVHAQIPSSRAVPTAMNRGVVLVRDEPKHPVSQAMRRFANELIADAKPTARAADVTARSGEPRRFGLLRRGGVPA